MTNLAKFICILFVSFFGFANTADAILIDLLNMGTTYDGNNSVTVNVQGVQVTIEANGANTLNSNVGSFGIDDGTDATANNSDAVGGAEVLTLSFDFDVTFDALDAINLSGTETIELTIGANPTQSLTSSTGDMYTFTTANTVLVGETVTLSATNGDFGLESFTITAPEPSTFVLLGMAGSGLAFYRFKRAKS